HPWGLADFQDTPLERAAGIRIHPEQRTLPGPHRTDVCLADRCIDPHVRQVARNREERRRLQTRGYGLAELDAALNHYPLDWRPDRSSLEIEPRSFERCASRVNSRCTHLLARPCGRQLCGQRPSARLRPFGVASRDVTGFRKCSLHLKIAHGVIVTGLYTFDGCFGLFLL